ncbi:MAG: hypothetical protein ACK5W9_09875 [Bdellovibrionales bacterium]
MNSMQLEGYRSNEFLKVEPTINQTPISSSGVTTLLELIAGISSNYVKPTDALSGDLGGTFASPTVSGLRGRPVSSTAPVLGQVLKFNGNEWIPSADDSGGASGDASYAAKGIVQFDTNQAVSGIVVNSGLVRLPDTITAGGPVGTASQVPVITYDSKGRLTAVSTVNINDSSKLPLAGGTMTGSIDMGLANVTNATSVAAGNFSGRNLLLNDNDNNKITLRTPSNITADYTLTLPLVAPTNGYILSSDASGQLSWVAPSGSGPVGVLSIADGGTNSSTALTNNKVMISSAGAIIEGAASSVSKASNTFVMRDGSGGISGANGSFDQLILNGSVSGIVNVLSPAALTSWSLTLPSNSGSNGQALVTDGNGVTSWANVVSNGSTILAGNGSAGAPGFAFASTGNQDNGMFLPVDNQISFSTAGAERVQINESGNVGVGTSAGTNRLTVQGSARTPSNIVASGALVDLSVSNIHYLKAVGGSTITLQNLIDGTVHTLYIVDLASRTYTFSGCTNTYFTPANSATSFRSTYTVSVIVDGADTQCFVNWSTGYN